MTPHIIGGGVGVMTEVGELVFIAPTLPEDPAFHGRRDAEMLRFERILAEAHELLATASVPVARSEQPPEIVTELDRMLYGGHHPFPRRGPAA